jgi:hypothetical protein
VYALVVRVLTPAAIHPNDPNDLAQRNGKDILRTDAMIEYDVWSISILIFVTIRALMRSFHGLAEGMPDGPS